MAIAVTARTVSAMPAFAEQASFTLQLRSLEVLRLETSRRSLFGDLFHLSLPRW